jgi:hypothetical protein
MTLISFAGSDKSLVLEYRPHIGLNLTEPAEKSEQ